MRVLRWLLIALVLSASLVQAQTAPVVLSSTTCPGTGCTEILVNGYGTVGIQITGTFSGTLTFEQTIAGTWRPLKVAEVNTPSSQVTTTTTAGLFSGSVSATRVRVRFSAHSSGSATITAVRTQARNGSSGGGSGNPFDQDLNTTDSPTFNNLTVAGKSVAGASRWIGPYKTNAFAGQLVYVSGSGSVTGGTFTITYDGQTTSALAYDVGPAAVKTAIEALSNVGAGNVLSVVSGGNLDFTVVFKGLTATELMTLDASGITGPDAPYSGVGSGAVSWAIDLATVSLGDIVEDFLHYIPTAFNSGAYLTYTDDPDNPEENGPAWSNPVSAQGVPSGGGVALNQDTTSFTNFGGYNGAGVRTQPSALTILTAAWANAAAGTGTDFYGNLPAVALNTTELYAWLTSIDTAPTAGEIWIWVKVASPVVP